MICKKCGKKKPIKQYNKNQDWCKACTKQYGEEYREKLWLERKPHIEQHLGTSCYLCDAKENLHTHEKYGKEHKPLLRTPIPEMISNLKCGRFVNLCRACHQGKGKVHDLMSRRKKWDEIRKILFVPRQLPLPIEVDTKLVLVTPKASTTHEDNPRIDNNFTNTDIPRPYWVDAPPPTPQEIKEERRMRRELLKKGINPDD